jgi:two-component system, sensor histidine kinase and response regulator
MSAKCVPLMSWETIRLPESGRNDHVSWAVAMLYLDSTPVLLQVMRKAMENGNIHQIGHAANALASSSANLGAVRLASLCRQIAALPSKDALLASQALLEEIDQAAFAVCKKLTELIGSSPSQQSA